MGNSSIRHSCEHMRSHALALSPLARGSIIPLGANILLRQGCASLRNPNTPAVSVTLTASVAQEPNHRIVRPPPNPWHHLSIGVPTSDCRSQLRPSQGGDVGISTQRISQLAAFPSISIPLVAVADGEDPSHIKSSRNG